MGASIPIAVTTLATSRLPRVLSSGDSPILGKAARGLRAALLRWYEANRRDLPWRATDDPYRIWVSEIMLQQTRVAAVLEHYRIFLERFPNVRALAAASEDAVLSAWSGLGYYRRARMLHRCARQIVEENAARFPQNSEALLALPGIGRYTAAAIASIAFAEPVAVVDGNVERVLERLTGRTLTAPQTWRQAQTLLDTSRPGDFNQAMMELGATVCTPREPRCGECPVRKWCIARGHGPRPRAVPRQKKKVIWLAFDCRPGGSSTQGKIRLVRRPKDVSLMPGMWELPQLSMPPRQPAATRWRTFRHSITVTEYTVHVVRDPARLDSSLRPRAKWIEAYRLPHLPLTGLTRKILKAGGVI